MNAVYLMQNTHYKDLESLQDSKGQKKYLKPTSILSSTTTQAKKIMQEWDIPPQRIQKQLSLLNHIKTENNQLSGDTNYKMSNKDSNWINFLNEQIRYDLIFTNSIIVLDDLRYSSSSNRDVSHQFNEDGSLLWRIAATKKRKALEHYGAYISLDDLKDERLLKSTIIQVLWNLILPSDQVYKANFPPNKLCFQCSEYWKKRKEYLKTIYKINNGRNKKACQALHTNYLDYTKVKEHSPFFLSPKRAIQMKKNYILLAKSCD